MGEWSNSNGRKWSSYLLKMNLPIWSCVSFICTNFFWFVSLSLKQLPGYVAIFYLFYISNTPTNHWFSMWKQPTNSYPGEFGTGLSRGTSWRKLDANTLGRRSCKRCFPDPPHGSWTVKQRQDIETGDQMFVRCLRVKTPSCVFLFDWYRGLSVHTQKHPPWWFPRSNEWEKILFIQDWFNILIFESGGNTNMYIYIYIIIYIDILLLLCWCYGANVGNALGLGWWVNVTVLVCRLTSWNVLTDGCLLGSEGNCGTNLISDIMHMAKEKGKTLNSGILPRKIC